MKRVLPIAALLLVLLAAAGPAVAQCAMCKAALEGSEEGRAIGATFNRAILVMLAAPYLVFLTVAAAVLRGRIRSFLGAAWLGRRSRVRPAPAPR